MGGSSREQQVLEAAWGVGTCPKCGAVMILGEPTARLRVHGRAQRVCAACAAMPADDLATVRALPKPVAVPAGVRREAA
jgi:hypothetical protein